MTLFCPFCVGFCTQGTDRADVVRMQEINRAIETVAGMSVYQNTVLQYASETAKFQRGPIGIFMGLCSTSPSSVNSRRVAIICDAFSKPRERRALIVGCFVARRCKARGSREW